MNKKKKNWMWILVILVLLLLFLYLIINKDEDKEVVDTDTTTQFCEGFPNFVGTPRVGEPCEDTLDCTNHPPINYVSGSLECVNGKCKYPC